MTVQLQATIQRWLGLSSDSKPATPTYVGSEFYEYDTARTWVWNGSDWVVKTNTFWRFASKSITFDGATLNGIGDFNGTGNPSDIFTVTGIVQIKLVAVCTTVLSFDANATIEAGVSGNTGVLIPTTDLSVSALIANEIWHDATPTTTVDTVANSSKEYVITNGQDIILTCGVANTNTGVILFTVQWLPLSSGGLVVAA